MRICFTDVFFVFFLLFHSPQKYQTTVLGNGAEQIFMKLILTNDSASRATVSAVSGLVVPAFICIDLLISRVLKINDDDDDENGVCIAVPKWGLGPINFLEAKNYTLRNWW